MHQAKVIKNFFISSGIRTLKLPAKSPDINNAEDVLPDLVYDGPQYQNKNDFEKAINETIFAQDID